MPQKYKSFFRKNDNNSATYSQYITSSIVNNRKTISHSKSKTNNTSQTATFEDFLKCAKKLIESVDDGAKQTNEYKYLIQRIEDNALCKKLRISENAYFPNQLAQHELEKILNQQKSNFPNILTEENVAKLKQLITFRIPFFVGPLSDKDDKFAWVKRTTPNSNVSITPWNFDKEIDLFATGERFIQRMLSKCTYLKNEYVLPQQSILYQEFLLLNDLNNLKINGNRITQDLKYFLYSTICQTETSLTKKKIEKFLRSKGKIDYSDKIGKGEDIDINFNSSLSSIIKLKSALGLPTEYVFKFDEIECLEQIIKWHTVFGDEKKEIKYRIVSEYGNLFTNEQINKLSKLSFSGWGKLSRIFLCDIKTNCPRHYNLNNVSIINVLEETTMNLMEILNSEYFSPMYLKLVKKFNEKYEENTDISYDDVKELYCSPIVKRSIWQSILVTKDLLRANNNIPPKKVFVEVTRGQDLSKMGKLQSSRKMLIESLYKNAKDIDRELQNNLNRVSNDQLRSDRIFFYFMQFGKCMYTGQKLDFRDVVDSSGMYDIDHIYPESKVIDDSLSNRVLVLKNENASKTDKYPLSEDIQIKMYNFWDRLKSLKLMDQKKFDRLTSTKELTYEQIAAFNNRQLVSTSQAVKSVCQLLSRMFGSKTEVIYSKARHVSDFRRLFDITKCRDINDIHHAHDAYLNIVVGNVWHEMFKFLPGSNENRQFYNMWGKLCNENIYNEANNDEKINVCSKLFNHNYLYTYKNEYLWSKHDLKKVTSYTKNCSKYYLNKYSVTRMTKVETGAFYDETHYMKASKLIPVKENFATDKYGGYSSDNTAYLCVVEYSEQKSKKIETKRVFCRVPIRFVCRYEGNELLEKICEVNNLPSDIRNNNIKLIYDRIYFDSVIEIDGIRYFVKTGTLSSVANCQWYPSDDIVCKIKACSKFYSRMSNCKSDADKENISYPKVDFDTTSEVFISLIEQLKKPFYQNYTFARKINSGKISLKAFEKLKLYQRIEEIMHILYNISHAKSESSTCISEGTTKESSYKCEWRNPKLSEKNSVYLISQSPTGLYESKVKLM